jgi:uncharacterized protein YndB with AHSA1/START domain
MSAPSAAHGVFVIERALSHPVALVFQAFAEAQAKAEWFVGPNEQWKLLERAFDFRVGGKERVVGAWAGSGVVSHFDCTYFDIVDNARIVYCYEMHLNEKKISVSLATIEFKAVGKGTRLKLTEQGVFLDGYDDAGAREHGTNLLMDAMEASLQKLAV